MQIRLAHPNDIPDLLRLLEQILSVHHQARPDIFKGSGGKDSEEELDEILKKGALKASLVAKQTLERVREKLGYLR